MGVKFKAMTTIDKPDYVDRFLIKTSALSKAFGTKYIPDKDVCHWLVPGEGLWKDVQSLFMTSGLVTYKKCPEEP